MSKKGIYHCYQLEDELEAKEMEVGKLNALLETKMKEYEAKLKEILD